MERTTVEQKQRKYLKPLDLHFTLVCHSKDYCLAHLCTHLSRVKLQRVWIIKLFPSCVNWQGEQSRKMNGFRANPFFSVPLIGSLIYCHGTLQEGEPTVSGESGTKRERLSDFLDLTHFQAVAEFSLCGFFSSLDFLFSYSPPAPFFLSLEV